MAVLDQARTAALAAMRSAPGSSYADSVFRRFRGRYLILIDGLASARWEDTSLQRILAGRPERRDQLVAVLGWHGLALATSEGSYFVDGDAGYLAATFDPLLSPPGFVLGPGAASWYRIYLRTYLTGMDNSRIFACDGDTMHSEVRRSYERFMERYADTRPGNLVKRYYEVLRANAFRDGPSVQAFLRDNGIETMLGVQPPIR